MRPCQRALLLKLGTAGTWLGREQVARGLAWHEAVVDDELADLVTGGEIVFNARARQYRVAGGPLARRALREAHRTGRPSFAAQRRSSDGPYVVALAKQVQQADGTAMVVSAEVEFDYPGPVALANLVPVFHAWLGPAAPAGQEP